MYGCIQKHAKNSLLIAAISRPASRTRPGYGAGRGEGSAGHTAHVYYQIGYPANSVRKVRGRCLLVCVKSYGLFPEVLNVKALLVRIIPNRSVHHSSHF